MRLAAVDASEFHLIGKETERVWKRAHDIIVGNVEVAGSRCEVKPSRSGS
jgi:hypothetical protein